LINNNPKVKQALQKNKQDLQKVKFV